jgi:hypothetical protein
MQPTGRESDSSLLPRTAGQVQFTTAVRMELRVHTCLDLMCLGLPVS